MENKFNSAQSQTQDQETQTSKSKPKESKVGEYVDYEEID